MLTFNLRTGPKPALYAAVPDTPDGTNGLYYLVLAAGDSTLTLAQAWALRGAFVIAPAATDLASFPAATLQRLADALIIPKTAQGPAAIAWLPQGSTAAKYSVANSIALQNANIAKATAIVGTPSTVTVGPAALAVPQQTLVQIGTGPAATLALSNPSSVLSVSLTQQQWQQQPLTANDAIIAFDGPHVGAVSLAITDTSLFPIFAFCNPQLAGNQTVANGPDVRYYLAPPRSGGTVTELRFPVFAPASQTASDPPSFTLAMQLDPIWPFDAARTVMTPDLSVSGVPALFSLPLFTTTAGAPVTLSPISASLYFAQNQGGGYVAPAGTFTIGLAGKSAPLLCGLLAQEHILVNAGDTLTLLASSGAYPGGFPALVIGSAATVVAEDAIVTSSALVPGAIFTTPWLQYGPAGGKSGTYYAQPQPSVSFSSGGLQTSVAAVAAQLGSLKKAIAPVPMIAYAAAYPPSYSGSGPTPPGWPVGGTQYIGDVTTTWPNGSVPAASFAQAEHLGLAPMRYRALLGQLSRSKSLDPIFEVVGARGQGASATTKQGFVVELNPRPNASAPLPPAGSWNNLVLASYLDEVVALAPPAPAQVLDAQLVTTLLANQLFLVVDQVPLAPAGSPASPVTAVLNTMEVGGFMFDFNAKKLDPQASPPDRQILLFKFNDALSLNDLINQTAHWNTSYLQADPSVAQGVLQAAVTAAQEAVKSPDPTVAALFFDFVKRILVEPNWTGVIAFNCTIDATQMPPSLEILIAAAAGQRITAHHFGIEISQVVQKGQQVAIKQSSLFGVIAYDAGPQPAQPTPPPFSFWTQTLHVQIHNSSVTQFQAAIRVALNAPFGRSATCPADENAVTLAGAYQQQGKLGTVTFSEADPGSAIYTFTQGSGLRVLDQLAVRSATLLPGRQTTDKGTTTIPGRIVMGGTLLFAADPFTQGVDLFGYGKGTGTSAAGLDFTGFTLVVSANIDSQGVSGQTTAQVDYSGMKVSAGSAALRDNSLVRGLPCQVDAFLADTTNGLSADSLQAQPVHVLQLENVSVPAPLNPLQPPNSDTSSPSPPATVQANYTTPAPSFAVTFDLPLGSLGGLADAHASLDTSLILGWGPNPATPDDDAAAVLIKLPFASVGYGGFNLQGVLKTVFGDANLMQVSNPSLPAKPYVILFNNVQLSVFGIKLPPHVLSDLVVFVPGGDKPGPMGMCLMAKQT
jgi:hypothetical protein